MNKKIKNILFFILIVVWASLASRAVSYVFAADTVPPQLKSVSVPSAVVVPGGYFTVIVSAADDSSGVKAINIIFESPSGASTLHKESVSVDSTGTWYANIFMPLGVEPGVWKVKSVYLVDNSGNSKNYFYGSDLSQFFNVSSATTGTQNSSSAGTICTSFDYSAWSDCYSDSTKKRTIVKSYPDGCIGGIPSLLNACNISSTVAPASSAVVCNFVYSDWSACQASGIKTRNILSVYPAGCAVGAPTVSSSCTNCSSTRPYLNDMNGDNCISSRGTWNSTYCVCTCPSGYTFSGTGCLYNNTSTTSSTNTTSTSSGAATTSTVCNFTYSDWSDCQADGIKTRSVLTTYPTGCYGSNQEPLVQTCTPATTVANTATTATAACNFTYSDWSACQSNGTRTRSLLTKTPTGCTGTPELSGSCTPVLANTTTTAQTCNFTYSDWSACQTNGTKTRSVLTTSPAGCTVGTPILSDSCTYFSCDSTRPTLNDMNMNNCIDSGGSWISTSCACTCPSGYKFSGTGCLYVPPVSCAFTYSDWTECKDGKQSRTILNKSPEGCVGGQQESLSRYCLLDSVCQRDQWTCEEWGQCKDGKQTRSCNLSFDCPGVSEISPKTEQTCTLSDTNKVTAESTDVICQYKYSDYGDCQNGKQYRTVIEKSPIGCVDKTVAEPLEKTCTSATAQSQCLFTYSPWSDCQNGKKTRNILSKTPDGCTSGSAVVEDKCQNVCSENDWKCDDWGTCGSEGMQYRKCSLSQDCLSNKDLISPQTTRSCVYRMESNGAAVTENPATSTGTSTQTNTAAPEVKNTVTTNTAEAALPAECVKSGWTDKNDCELYLYHSRIVSDCRSSGLNTQDQCREYLLSKYGKPLKCQNLSDESCNALINNFILADMKTVISPEVEQKLTEVAGMTAVIDVQNKTITVEVAGTPTSAGGNNTQTTKEVKVDNMPITSSVSEQVSVSLLSTQVKSEQQNLSPVAIAFDSDGDGLPNDVEKRLGTDPNKKDTDGDGYNDSQELQAGSDPLNPLSTPLNVSTKKSTVVMAEVDKAIVNGKSLEQPKYSTPTAITALAVSSVATVKPQENQAPTNNLKFEGKAKPNQVITLFIYSTMPIVVTVQADANGNWNYELDKTLVDGTHEVYVAVNNNEGKIVESSLPTPFFIEKAQAVSVNDFVATGDASQIPSQATNMMMLYVFSGVAVILLLIAAFLIIKQRFAD